MWEVGIESDFHQRSRRKSLGQEEAQRAARKTETRTQLLGVHRHQ